MGGGKGFQEGYSIMEQVEGIGWNIFLNKEKVIGSALKLFSPSSTLCLKW
jgi:hypothetical protein